MYYVSTVRVFLFLCLPQIRNKLNQDQNSKLQQHKDVLNRRNTEVTLMDRRIAELRDRLHKKKAEVRHEGAPMLQGGHGAPMPAHHPLYTHHTTTLSLNHLIYVLLETV